MWTSFQVSQCFLVIYFGQQQQQQQQQCQHKEKEHKLHIKWTDILILNIFNIFIMDITFMHEKVEFTHT